MVRLSSMLFLPICLTTVIAVGCTEQHPQTTIQIPDVKDSEDGEVSEDGKAELDHEPAKEIEPTKEVAVEKTTSEKKKVENSKKQEVVKMPSYNELNDFEKYVILHKGTERPGTGKLEKNKAKGTYICRRCNAALYKSEHKFASGCGWPAFDDEIKGAVKRAPDADGLRIEIVCQNCDGHLGHVFLGEGFTKKNVRHCVNSVSMKFIANGNPLPKMIKLNDGEEEEKKSGKEESTGTDEPSAEAAADTAAKDDE